MVEGAFFIWEKRRLSDAFLFLYRFIIEGKRGIIHCNPLEGGEGNCPCQDQRYRLRDGKEGEALAF